MKKQLFFLCMVLTTCTLNGQSPIPNADFELWTSNSIENPTYFPFSSNQDNYRNDRASNIVKFSPGYHGQYAVQLSTETKSLGYLINTDPSGGNPALWTNGMAYTGMPTGVRGYYKYNVATADSGLIIFTFRKNSTVIGDYKFRVGGIQTNYTLFDFNFTPALTQSPDSVIVGFVSSDYYKNPSGVPGSVLVIDSVSLKGVANQPLELNGDFENWEQIDLAATLNDWNKWNKEMIGITRSTSSKTGQYALELTTYLGEENGTSRAQPGFATNGYWENNCNCMKGGIPFSNLKDTLTFWYKYTPTQGDMAQVNLAFRKNGTQFDARNVNLNASIDYQHVESPFELGMVPDSVIINIISSQWENKATSFVGSKLIIDKLSFKTGAIPTDIQNLKLSSNIFPNPTRGILHLNTDARKVKRIGIYTLAGKVLYSTTEIVNKIDISAYSIGIYLIKLEMSDSIMMYKIIKTD